MKCPGQDMQYWDSNAIFDIECPNCRQPVEFYKDDTSRKCDKCGHRFVNPKMDFGCAAYCQFAEQCIGALPEEFAGARDNLLKDKVAVEMKRFYKNDFRKIGRISRIARYAETIGKKEKVNMGILLCTAYLHDIGTGEASTNKSEKEHRVTVASEILDRLGAREQIKEEVCRQIELIGTDNAGDCSESRVLSDAVCLADMEEKRKEQNSTTQHIESLQQQFLTEGGRQTARELFS